MCGGVRGGGTKGVKEERGVCGGEGGKGRGERGEGGGVGKNMRWENKVG